MSKRITMSARPNPKPNVDDWVEKRVSRTETTSDTKPKRLTIDIAPNLHTDLKVSCAKRGIQISDLLRELIERDIRSHETD